MDSLLDRGNVKWTTMMLTEHRVALKQMQQHVNDVPEPKPSEEKLTEIAEVLGRAMGQGSVVDIHYYHANHYHRAKGKVVRWDPAKQSIIMEQGIAIPVRYILKAEIDE